MRYLPLILLLTGCASVTKDLGSAGKTPGMWVCAGKATVSAVGQALVYGANGSITFDCGEGAYFGQGYPASNLPTMPSASAPQIKAFPPLGQPPS